jgi:FkbM family methyltransferase
MGVALHKRAAASVMRRLPVQVRKIRYLRDRAYVGLGAGAWDEDDALDAKWTSPLQTIRGKHGLLMELDLTDWCQRRTYFTGRYYQEDLEDLISLLLRPGDAFVDIGANIGLVSLHAASIVGNEVYPFEPNPEVFTRLLRHLGQNGFRATRAINIGLGSEAGTMTLNLFGRQTGKASLVPHDEQSTRTVKVKIQRGDEVLKVSKPTLIKIDVEGYEVSALDGLGAILDQDVAVVAEVTRDWLERAGSSAEALYALMESHGLMPYSFGHSESRFERALIVEPQQGPKAEAQYDCLFVRPGSTFHARLEAATR